MVEGSTSLYLNSYASSVRRSLVQLASASGRYNGASDSLHKPHNADEVFHTSIEAYDTPGPATGALVSI